MTTTLELGTLTPEELKLLDASAVAAITPLLAAEEGSYLTSEDYDMSGVAELAFTFAEEMVAARRKLFSENV